MGWIKNQNIRVRYNKATEDERETMRRDYPEALAPVLRIEAKQAKLDQAHGDQKARKAARKAVRSGKGA
jgi:hypothetical protein